VAGGIPLSLEVALPGDAVGASAWLLTPDEARRLGAGEEIPLLRPLEVTATAGGARLDLAAPVPPGEWLLYVRTAAGDDNRDRLVPVHLARMEAVGPLSAMAGVDAAPRFQVLRDGAPAQGRLILASVSLPIDAGTATLEAADLDALAPGRYALSFEPEDARVRVPLERDFEVRAASLALSPLHVAEGAAATLTLSLPGHDGPAPEVRVQGVPVPLAASGKTYAFQLPALAPGVADVQVGRLHRAVTVHPDLAIGLTLRDDRTLDLVAATPGGAPQADVRVSLDGAALGVTDETGHVAFSAPFDGQVRLLRLRDADGDEATRALRFEGDAVAEAEPRVQLLDFQQEAGAATARLRNDGVAPVALTVGAYLDGTLTDATGVRLAPGGSTEVRLNATGPGRLDVRAEPVRFSAITFSTPSLAPRDVSATVPLVSKSMPVATTPASVPTGVTPSPNFPEGAGMPAPAVPFPWALVVVALVGAALLLRRRR
jgi:hypothetical protein